MKKKKLFRSRISVCLYVNKKRWEVVHLCNAVARWRKYKLIIFRIKYLYFFFFCIVNFVSQHKICWIERFVHFPRNELFIVITVIVFLPSVAFYCSICFSPRLFRSLFCYFTVVFRIPSHITFLSAHLTFIRIYRILYTTVYTSH